MPRGETSTPGRCQSVLDKKLLIFTAARGACQGDIGFSLFRGPVPSVGRASSFRLRGGCAFRIEPPAFPVYNRAGAVQRFDEGAVRPIFLWRVHGKQAEPCAGSETSDAPTLTSRQLVKAWWQVASAVLHRGSHPRRAWGALAARDLGYWPWGFSRL